MQLSLFCNRGPAGGMRSTAPMDKDYNKSSGMQREWLGDALERLQLALPEEMFENLPPDHCFRVLELGCATGGNSTSVVQFLKSRLRASQTLHVYQLDLPTNEWSEAFASASTWVDARTTHTAIGRSFYEEHLVPAGSIDFIFSFTALHWDLVDLPFCFAAMSEAEYVAWHEATVAAQKVSCAILARNMLTCLAPHGVAFLMMPGLEGDVEKDRNHVVFAGLMGTAWATVLKAEPQSLKMKTVLKIGQIFEQAVREAGGSNCASETLIQPILSGGGGNVHQAAHTIASSFVSATLHIFSDRFDGSPEALKQQILDEMTRVFEEHLQSQPIHFCHLLLQFEKP